MGRHRRFITALCVGTVVILELLFSSPVWTLNIDFNRQGFTTVSAAPLPDSVDNSASPAFPPIGNQVGQNFCVSWAINYYQLTYETAVARGLSAKDFTFSPKWIYNMINGGENGNSRITDAYAILQINGAAVWNEFPYNSINTRPGDFLEWPVSSHIWWDAIYHRISGYDATSNSDPAALINDVKTQLAESHVLVFLTYLNSWKQTTIGSDPSTPSEGLFSGQYVAAYMNNTQKDLHAMTIVGYNDDIWVDLNGNTKVDPGEKGAFKIANSLGTDDWNQGFRWVSYDAVRPNSAVGSTPQARDQKGIFLGQVYTLTAKPAYTPTMVAEVTLNTLKRGQLSLSLGVGDSQTAQPASTWNSAAISNDGGIMPSMALPRPLTALLISILPIWQINIRIQHAGFWE